MRSRMAPQDEGLVLFDVDNIPICAILRSLFTQEGTLPERSVAGWRGGACGGGVPLRPPGRPPESGLAQRAIPQAQSGELARPGLRRGRVRERLKARRRRAFPHGPAEGDGERRSGGTSFRLCGRTAPAAGALRAGPDGYLPRDRNSVLTDGATRPAKGGATFPRGIGGVTAPMPIGPFAPESKTGVPKIAERGAPGRHPSLTKAPTARRSAPPVFICRTPRAKATGTRKIVTHPADPPYGTRSTSERAETGQALTDRVILGAMRLDGVSKERIRAELGEGGGREARPSRRGPKRAAPQVEANEVANHAQPPPIRHPGRSAAKSRDPGGAGVSA